MLSGATSPLSANEDSFLKPAHTPVVDPVPDSEAELDENELNRKLGQSLSGLSRGRGLTGWVAGRIAPIGKWIEKELDERRQTIGGIDNMWLLMSEATDSDFNPVCACTYTMRGRMTEDMLAKAMERVFKKFTKYRQRLTSVGRKWHGARFENDPTFDTKNHIRTIWLPEPAGKNELETLMGEFIAQPWDLSKPLWEMILVNNYRDEDGAECALVVRGHHTLADGQGFVIGQLYMTSYYEELVKLMSLPPPRLTNGSSHHNVLPSSVHPSLRPLDPLSDPSNFFISPLIQLLLAGIIWSGYGFAFLMYFGLSTYHLLVDVVLFLSTAWRVDMLTPSQKVRTIRREFASSRAVSMEDVRTCQRAFSGSHPGAAKNGRSKKHVTVNDIMCSVMTDVLGEEIRLRKPECSLWGRTKKILNSILPSPIAFFIPISVRTAGDWSMRNLSTGWLVYLYPSSHSPKSSSAEKLYAHIHRCRRSLMALKQSLWPRVIFFIIQATGQAPVMWPVPFGLMGGHFVREWLMVPLIKFALRSFPVILTNVPGPAKKSVLLEGVEVIRWTALPPQAGKGTLGMGIISYAGGMSIAIAADSVPGSQGVARAICDRFEQRFEKYVNAAEQVLSETKGE